MRAELAHDAGGPKGFPSDGLPEVALLGRSNVGKSTLMNALVGRRRLARTSGTPGKTRRIHFYRVEGAAYLVDFPGYGYARVARSERASWRGLVEVYLRGTREPLRGALVLVDVRRDPTDQEQDLIDWLESEQIPVRIVLTKADKLSANRARARADQLARQWGLPREALAVVSARTGRGLGIVAGWLEEWLGLPLERADGSAFPR